MEQSQSPSTARHTDNETSADRTRILELEEQVSRLQRQKEALLKELDMLTARYRNQS